MTRSTQEEYHTSLTLTLTLTHIYIYVLGGEEARVDEVDTGGVPHVRGLAILEADVAARLELHLGFGFGFGLGFGLGCGFELGLGIGLELR